MKHRLLYNQRRGLFLIDFYSIRLSEESPPAGHLKECKCEALLHQRLMLSPDINKHIYYQMTKYPQREAGIFKIDFYTI